SPTVPPADDVPWWPKERDGQLIPQLELTAENLPCPHRGDVVRADQRCSLCGQTDRQYDVYACAKFGECSLIPSTKGGRLSDCFKCEVRRAAIATPLGALPIAPQATAKRSGPIRVALLTPDLGAGGAERWIASLAKHLPRDRVEMTAVGVVRDGQKWDPVAREITATGTAVYGTRGVRWGIHPTEDSTVTFVETDDEVCRKTMAGADVVISWGISETGPLLAAADWRGRHVIVSHGSSQWSFDRLSAAAPTATHCVAVSADAARACPAGTNPVVLWNGSELERLAPTRSAATVRRSWGCSPNDLLVGYVGRLSPEKNPLAVARLAAVLQARLPHRKVRPVWIGAGIVQVVPGMKAEAAAIAGDACVWVPPPPHIGDAWGALDLHVMASPEEGFALVVTEALVCGVPTVATRVGIVPEIIANWGNLVVPVDPDPTGDQLADAAEIALSEQHQTNVRRARTVVWEEFTAARMGSRWADFLQSIIEV
ncbi:MAG: glycosyltransferase family 4 protein, partial [Planctomycetaceae bacterium]|nr:glycosyltransferase family 4 protein [Planctomycetaceae bacterium]